jgi:hypothetical protein
MENKMQDAYADADKLYAEYARLSELGQLGQRAPDSNEGCIVASVSPVLLESYANAIVG